MITKNDCMSVLVKLEDTGLDVNAYIKLLLTSKDIPLDVLRVIEKHRGIEAIKFYEMLRKSYNAKKSPLYKNIVSCDFADEHFVITTLACLLVQIELYSSKLEEAPATFLQTVRVVEVTEALHQYFTSGDWTIAAKLLQVIRADLVVLEHIAGRREIK